MKHIRKFLFVTALLSLSTIIGIAFPVLAQDEEMTTYSSPDRSLSFPYPASWGIIQDNEQISVTTDTDPYDYYRQLEEGEFIVNIVLPDTLSQLDIESTTPPEEVLNILIPLLAEQDQIYGEVEAITIADESVPASRTMGMDDYGNDFALASLGFPAGTITIQAIGASGTLADSPAFDIIFNMSYVEPEPIDITNLQAITADNALSIGMVMDLSDPEYYLGYGSGFLTESGSFVVQNELVENDEYFVVLQLFNLIDDSNSVLVDFRDYEAFEWLSYVGTTPDGSQIVTSHGDGAVRWWNPETGEILNTVETGFASTRGFVISADNSMLAVETSTEDYESSVTLIDIASSEVIGTVTDGTFTLSSDGSMLIVGNNEGIFVYDTSTLESGDPIIVPEAEFDFELALSPDDSTLALATTDDVIAIYDMVTFEMTLSFVLENDRDYIEHLLYSPDGSMIIVAQRSEILFFDASTGDLLNSLRQSIGGAADILAISPDSTTLIYGGYDSLAVWGVAGE